MPDPNLKVPLPTVRQGEPTAVWVLLCASLLLFLVSVFTPGNTNVALLSTLVGWVLAAVTCGYSALRGGRMEYRILPTLAAVMVLAGQTMVVVHRVRTGARAMETTANMMGLDQLIYQYVEEHGDYPQSLQDLPDIQQMPHILVSPFDSESAKKSGSPADPYSTFVYRPGKGTYRIERDLIVFYEHCNTPQAGLALRPNYGKRLVRFADGMTEFLSPEEFDRALERDTKQRKEIGWPLVSVRSRRDVSASAPATTEPSQR